MSPGAPKCQPGCVCNKHYKRWSLSEYNRNHRLVKEARGKAADQICIDCGEPAQEWSQRHDTDGSSIEDFDPRCKRCHREYDGTGEWRRTSC